MRVRERVAQGVRVPHRGFLETVPTERLRASRGRDPTRFPSEHVDPPVGDLASFKFFTGKDRGDLDVPGDFLALRPALRPMNLVRVWSCLCGVC